MENLNKIISLVVGLVVVIVLFAILSGRINLRDKLSLLGGGVKKITLTPTIKPTPKTTQKITPTLTYEVNRYQTSDSPTPNKIPSTGVSTILVPVLFSSLFVGVYLRNK